MKTLNNISRRRFLAHALVCSSYSWISLGSMLATDSHAQDLSHPYSFADQEALGPVVNATTVEQACCALHPEEELPHKREDSEEYAAVSLALKEEFKKAGLAWDARNQISFTFQHYGVPDTSSPTKELLEYCKQANEYLYNRLNHLFDVDVDWQHLTHGGNHSQHGQVGFRGYVGRYNYYVMRAVVDGGTASNDWPYLVTAWPVERAINHVIDGQSYRPTKGMLYIIPGTTSLVAPFSELLHLSLHAASQRYADALSQHMPKAKAASYAKAAGETANEAAATLIASEFLAKQHCQNLLPSINLVAQSMASKFSALPKAIAYMKRHGIQASLNIYQDSPAEFMNRVIHS